MPPAASLLDIFRDDFVPSFLFDIARYLIGAGLIAALVGWLRKTSWVSRKIQQRQASRADFIREFGAAFRTVLVYTAAKKLKCHYYPLKKIAEFYLEELI